MTAEAARWSVRHLCIYHGDARLLLHDPTTRPPAAHNLSVGWSYDACCMLDTTVRKHKVMTLSTTIRGPDTRHEKLLGVGMRGRDDGYCRARRRNVLPQRNQPTMFWEMEDDDDA